MVAPGPAFAPDWAQRNLVPTLCRGRGPDLVPGGGPDLVPERGARPCAGYLCEDLVPGTCAGILIRLHHSATVRKSSTENMTTRFRIKVLPRTVNCNRKSPGSEMKNGWIRVPARPLSLTISPKNYVYDNVLNDLGSGTRGPSPPTSQKLRKS